MEAEAEALVAAGAFGGPDNGQNLRQIMNAVIKCSDYRINSPNNESRLLFLCLRSRGRFHCGIGSRWNGNTIFWLHI